jgi:hypothetical protein
VSGRLTSAAEFDAVLPQRGKAMGIQPVFQPRPSAVGLPEKNYAFS